MDGAERTKTKEEAATRSCEIWNKNVAVGDSSLCGGFTGGSWQNKRCVRDGRLQFNLSESRMDRLIIGVTKKDKISRLESVISPGRMN
jgi:hypothetical protein